MSGANCIVEGEARVTSEFGSVAVKTEPLEGYERPIETEPVDVSSDLPTEQQNDTTNSEPTSSLREPSDEQRETTERRWMAVLEEETGEGNGERKTRGQEASKRADEQATKRTTDGRTNRLKTRCSNQRREGGAANKLKNKKIATRRSSRQREERTIGQTTKQATDGRTNKMKTRRSSRQREERTTDGQTTKRMTRRSDSQTNEQTGRGTVEKETQTENRAKEREQLEGRKEKRKYECSVCGKSYTTRGSLNRHKAIEHLHKRHRCEKCGRTYKQKKCLEQHKYLKHSAKIMAFSCNTCFKVFEVKSNLKEHLKSHQPPSITCDVCDTYKTTSIRLLKAHIERTHGKKK